MDNNRNEIYETILDLKVQAIKYAMLVAVIKNENKQSYFDIDKIVSIVNVLEETKGETNE